jgi:hypothetical protein
MFGAEIRISDGVAADGADVGVLMEPVTFIDTVALAPNRFPCVINAGVVVTLTA